MSSQYILLKKKLIHPMHSHFDEQGSWRVCLLVTSVKYIAFFVKESLLKMCDGILGRQDNRVKGPEARGKAKFKKHQEGQSS